MPKPVFKRRMIALAATYLVVLQALLLPLSVAAGSPFVGPPCSTSASSVSGQPAGQPANHNTGCPCAAGCGMQCCAQALAAPVAELSALVPVVAYALVPLLAPVIVALAPIRSPSIPRAPPAA